METKLDRKLVQLTGALADFKQALDIVDALNDRNRLSHIYSHDQFKEIHMRLDSYYGTMSQIPDKLASH